MTTQSRPHSPITGRGRAKRASRTGGEQPPAVRAAWPGESAMPALRVRHHRARKPMHPDCRTDTHPHRALVQGWLRQRMTPAQAIEAAGESPDALTRRALDVFAAMDAALPVHLRGGAR